MLNRATVALGHDVTRMHNSLWPVLVSSKLVRTCPRTWSITRLAHDQRQGLVIPIWDHHALSFAEYVPAARTTLSCSRELRARRRLSHFASLNQQYALLSPLSDRTETAFLGPLSQSPLPAVEERCFMSWRLGFTAAAQVFRAKRHCQAPNNSASHCTIF